MSLDYSRWSNFTRKELQCQHTGADNPNEILFTTLMDMVQNLRDWYGYPMTVNSGYSSPFHPIEQKKANPGQHTVAAIDFMVDQGDVHKVLAKCFEVGFRGIGVNMKGNHRFIHIDLRKTHTVWSY